VALGVEMNLDLGRPYWKVLIVLRKAEVAAL